ncbi:MAG: alpha/beta fold hydrolase [Leifsonia sp.]|uniref:alpha/beta fold hydrolase n=1 Tax=Leifsonia sp. TaxID=1870902 RepID=UPI003F7E3BAC
MEIVLVPGYWLTANVWQGVVPALEAAGHHAHPVTRTGEDVPAQIAAIVAAVDGIGDPAERDVVLVGHSAGGPLADGVLDARPDRVSRIVFVDSAPLSPGGVVPSGLEPVDGVVPLPDWDDFEDADLMDLTDEQREAMRRDAVAEPGGVVTGAIELRDERRRQVPATVVACEFTGADLRRWVAAGEDFCKELGELADWEVVELPTGHWPMLTRPAELGAILAEAASR